MLGQHIIIPEPVSYTPGNSTFLLSSQTVIQTDVNNEEIVNYVGQLKDYLSVINLNPGVSSESQSSKGSTINIQLSSENIEDIGDEGYLLNIKKGTIELIANDPGGIFNGIQTMKQLIPVNPGYSSLIKITGCEIKDYPRFEWRGLMLDVSRHFFSVDEVKAYIDKMSEYKFNTFHWHLTDDEGWRIEIKSLPKLTEVGAFRVERYGRFGDNRPYPKKGERPTYGGYYTQDQIKDVVAYAADRNITIVPEIDMPGHSMAALAAYPELSTRDEPKFVNPGSKFAEWYGDGQFKMLIENTLDPSDEAVYEFVDKVFTEVAELFPGDYIHMGGDEAYHGFWDESSQVRRFMRKNNINDSHELQSYFVNRVGDIIASKGKKMIGWDEILEGELNEGSAVMSWRGMKGGIEAAKQGYKVVMSPTTFAYLDYTQGDHSVENRIYADLSLEKTYAFEPVPEAVNPEIIMGGQGNLWTEVIPTLQFAFYMTYPRALSLSESLWSQKEDKIWENFIIKTEAHFDRFDHMNINISKAVYEPQVNIYKSNDKLMCALENSVPGTEIFYTIDNTYPVNYGLRYKIPFEIPKGDLSLRTQTFRNGASLGRELIIHRTDLEKRAR
ncbi:MAG TPA: beta-N-acetylhexosaminidase [Cyclobacteriaceae bacterium]